MGPRALWVTTVALGVLASVWPLPAALATGTAVELRPAAQAIAVGQATTVTLYVENIQGLHGYQTTIGFNAAVLEVVDADSNQPGTQVALGSFLQPDFTHQNKADNELGAVYCVVLQMAPRAPVDGSGALFTITFRGKDRGAGHVYLTDLKLVRADGTAIATSQQNAQITVGNVTASTPMPTATYTAPTRIPQPAATVGGYKTTIYVVRPGDTLTSISRRFGVDVGTLARMNQLTNPSRIYAGQALIVPRDDDKPEPTPAPGTTPVTHTVHHNDTLYTVARRYGTTAQVIGILNHIANPASISVGEQLIVSAGTAAMTQLSGPVHVVQRGDTLCSLARRHSTNVWAIALANHLDNPNVIYAGQRLVIP